MYEEFPAYRAWVCLTSYCHLVNINNKNSECGMKTGEPRQQKKVFPETFGMLHQYWTLCLILLLFVVLLTIHISCSHSKSHYYLSYCISLVRRKWRQNDKGPFGARIKSGRSNLLILQLTIYCMIEPSLSSLIEGVCICIQLSANKTCFLRPLCSLVIVFKQ